MDTVESSVTPRRSGPGRSSNIEVLVQSNCLLVCCVLVGFFSVAVCLAVGMASGWLLSGPWLYIFLVFGFLGLICWCVVGWQFHLMLIDRDRRLKENRQMEQDIAIKQQMRKLAEKADRQGDSFKYRITDKEAALDIIRSATGTRQAAAGRVVDAGRSVAPALAGPGSGLNVTQQGASSPALILPSRRLVVPPAYDLINVMRRFPLAPDNMFLGIDGYKSQMACDPAVELCHGAFNAASGRGKTILIRGLETQLLKLGYPVVHADIKFALIDEKGNDYRPIARALLNQEPLNAGGLLLPRLITREEYIYHFLQWLAGPELIRRRAMYGAGDHSYGVFFLFLEEMLYLISLYKDLGPVIGRLLGVGRSLGIKVFCVSTTFQVQNLKINSGMRENFESAWYLGGDKHSAAALLDMTVKELEEYEQENAIELGKGVSVFRNNNVAYKARLLRGGMASNDFVYWMLGQADDFRLPDGILPPLTDLGAGTYGNTPSGLVVPAHTAKRVSQHNTGELENRAVSMPADIPQTDPNGLVESFPTVPDNSRFDPQGEDKLVPDDLVEDLIYWYGKLGNVVTARQKIGLGNSRYQRHASFILRQRGFMV